MRKSIFPSCVPIQMPALPAFVSLDVSCKSNFYSRRCRSQANLTSWGERTSVREGHKVKQIMCLLYEAVIPCVSTVDLLFVLKFSNRPFFGFFLRSGNFLPLLCCRRRSLFRATLGSPRPRARPLTRDSTVSINAFRAELHAFSGVSQAAASADRYQIQSGA